MKQKKLVFKSEMEKCLEVAKEKFQHQQEMIQELIEGLNLDAWSEDLLRNLGYENLQKIHRCMEERDRLYEKLLNIGLAAKDD